MNQVYVERFKTDGYGLFRVPSIVCTAKGTVIVCCECRRGGDWGEMDIGLRRSTDGGKTWSDRMIVGDGEHTFACHNGVLLTDGENVHLFYHRNYSDLFHRVSTDDGLSWSEAENLTHVYNEFRSDFNWTVIAGGPGHGLVTSKGRMIIPVWMAHNFDAIYLHYPSVVGTIYSDDKGATWHRGEIIPAAEDFIDPNESALLELSDGRIMIIMRHNTKNGKKMVAYSPDGIGGWNGFHFEEALCEPSCCVGVTNALGELWFTGCFCEIGKRDNLTLMKGSPDGSEWETACLIDEKGGYSDIFFSKYDNKFYIVGETGRTSPDAMWTFSLSVTSISVDEI